LAKASDQFQARDVTFWGVFALATWGVAVLGANLELRAGARVWPGVELADGAVRFSSDI